MVSQQLSRIYLPGNLRKVLRDRIQILEMKTHLLQVYKVIIWLSVICAILLSAYIYFSNYLVFYRPFNKLMITAGVGVILSFVFYAMFWLFFITYINLMMYYRTKKIEENLPDYLGFTAANLRAGMPIDKALWLAIRPRFGPLAKEMEMVAKATMGGEDLQAALTKFANKYNSKVLKRSVSLLNEGLSAGGKISELISKIAWNLDEVKIMKEEISANVTNYVIFIGFATIIAAPLLFSLCSMLLYIISNLQSVIGPATQTAQSLPVSFMKSGISVGDFSIYAYLSLGVTSIFSSMIVSIIRKGNIRDGLKYIPVFLISAITIFIVCRNLLQLIFAGIF